MLDFKRLLVCGLALFGVMAAPALAGTITYEATVVINWNNFYLGNRTTVDSAATVVVDYPGDGSFTITSLDFNANESGIGAIILGTAGNTSGTIAGGVATGQMGYAGTAAVFTTC